MFDKIVRYVGATGGAMSTLMQGRPLFESGHFTSAILGLALLYVQVRPLCQS
jgi:hypothetical protein